MQPSWRWTSPTERQGSGQRVEYAGLCHVHAAAGLLLMALPIYLGFPRSTADVRPPHAIAVRALLLLLVVVETVTAALDQRFDGQITA